MGTLISTNIYSTQYFTLRDSRVSHSEMTNSMQRLSSGRKLNGPGDSPSDFGISAQYDFTVVNSKKSINNLLNAQNVLETSDTWLNNVQDMLRSMSELQVSSTDGSKNQGDRENLDLEYQQLKDEISRIGADTTFNGVQILGKDQFITYDDSANTFTLSQFDGGQAYQLPYKIADGLKSSNNKDFHFNENNSYTISDDGRFIFYVDSNQDLVRYNIETNEIVRDDSAKLKPKGLAQDEDGRFWYAFQPEDGDGNPFTLRQQDVGEWKQDSSLIDDTQITDMASKQFSVYDNRVYYRQATTDYIVSRDLLYPDAVRIELDSTVNPFDVDNYTLSADGRYLSDVQSAGTLRVLDLKTKEQVSINVGSASDIQNIQFGVDNREILFNDTVLKSIRRVELSLKPNLSINATETVMSNTGAGFSGLNISPGSNRSNFRMHIGPNAGDEKFIQTGDVRLFTLGISHTDVLTQSSAQDASQKIVDAIREISFQRAFIGSLYVRSQSSYNGLTDYTDELVMAKSRLTDSNVAEEMSRLTKKEIAYKSSLSMIAKIKSIQDLAVDLLRSTR